MFDLKVINSVLDQLEEERGVPKEKVLEAIEAALASAYKREYGKKGQIIKAEFDSGSGKTEFSQVKIVVDKDTVRFEENEDETDTEIATERSIVARRGVGDIKTLLNKMKEAKKRVELEHSDNPS